MRKILILIFAMTMLLFGCRNVSENETIKNEQNKVTESEVSTESVSENNSEFDVANTELNNENIEGTETVDNVDESENNTENTNIFQYTYRELKSVMYAKSSVNVRNLPSTEGECLGGLNTNQEVVVTGQCNETGWYRILYNNQVAFVSNNYLVNEKFETPPQVSASPYDDPNYEFYWHRNCVVGTSYLNEPTTRHCFYVDNVHYEVTEEVCAFMEDYRQQMFNEFRDAYRGWYTDETRQVLELHTLGSMGVVVTVEEFEEIYSDWGFIIYDCHWDYLVDQQNFVDTATTEKVKSMGYIQILQCAPGNECN